MGLYENLCFFSLEENVVILIYRKVYFHLAKVPRHKIPLKNLKFYNVTTSRRCKCVIQKWVLLLDFVHRKLDLFLWVFTLGAT